MRIGDLAAKTGASVRALRYYEEQGLLTSSRTSGAQRVYIDSDIERVRLVRSLFAAGLSSKAIVDTVLPCIDHPSAAHSQEVWDRMLTERDKLTSEITELERTRKALSVLLEDHWRYMQGLNQVAS
jgi:DNA-binding transcriptional MerR regulator